MSSFRSFCVKQCDRSLHSAFLVFAFAAAACFVPELTKYYGHSPPTPRTSEPTGRHNRIGLWGSVRDPEQLH